MTPDEAIKPKAIKVGEGSFTPHMFEHHYFRTYLAHNKGEVLEVEDVPEQLIHWAGYVLGLHLAIYVVHFAQDSSG